MITLELYRDPSTDQGTKSGLYLDDDEVCSMLELPWLENERGISCIPPGRYEVAYMKESASGKYKDVYHVKDVPGRTGILIHMGNWAGDISLGLKSDTDGCLLPCMSFKTDDNGQLMGLDSKTALQTLHEVTGRKGFVLEVYGV